MMEEDSNLYTSPNRRARKPLSCEPCRHSKLRCDRQLPCGTCLRRGWQGSCKYGTGPVRHLSRRRPYLGSSPSVTQQQEQSVQHTESVSSESPSAEPIHNRWDAVLRRPSVDKNSQSSPQTNTTFSLSFGPSKPLKELLKMLPPPPVREYLLSRYFMHLSSLFDVLHAPTFQDQYSLFLRDPQNVDLSWLALLFAIFSLTVKTTEPGDPGLAELWHTGTQPDDCLLLSQKYRDAALSALSQDQFLVRHNLSTLEALLILIHTISHSEGAERGWTLLGSALNTGIALRCHVESSHGKSVDKERRSRCWAGILILHTYQALLFRDIDLSFLLRIKARIPAGLDDNYTRDSPVLESLYPLPINQRPNTPMMMFQIRLFELSNRVCSHVSGKESLHEESLKALDSAVLDEQQQWDSAYLIDGAPSILDTHSYAHWCILQTYAHQLYLLLHRPFHQSRSTQFRPESRARCIKSGTALLDLHRQFYELPRLQCYRWLVNGTLSCNALHGAVALTSCLLDMPDDPDLAHYQSMIDAAVLRLGALHKKSPACTNIYPIMRHLRSRISLRQPVHSSAANIAGGFDDWLNCIDWPRADSIDWDSWDGNYPSPYPDR
ncbi:hypothetical protein GGI43DRAFT_405403 [Trichoderma evansii]